METRNPRFNASGSIDCEINTTKYGWVPFTASADDPEIKGRDLFFHLNQSAAKYIAEDNIESVPQVVSKFQAKAALLNAGLLDGVESELLAAEPIVRLAWRDATEFRRESHTIKAFSDGLGISSAELDDLFRSAAKIEA